MRIAVVSLLAFALPAFGQSPMTVTATVTNLGPETSPLSSVPVTKWRVSGVVTNSTVNPLSVMVYVRADGVAIPGTGPIPVKVGQAWKGGAVQADGTFSIEFTSPSPGSVLDVYTTTGGTYLPNLPARIAVPVP